jgi:hypothetical protein
MHKRVFFATLVAAALLVAPVAGVEAKPDGGGKSKKCDKPKRVGFKVNGTFASFAGTELSVEVVRANRHARDWLADGNVPSFDTSGVENIKFIGVTDTGLDGVGFADAVEGDRVKIKAKLELQKHGCETEDAVVEETTGLAEVDSELDVKKIKVKRPDATEID